MMAPILCVDDDKDILEALQNSPYKGDHLSFDPDANSASKGPKG